MKVTAILRLGFIALFASLYSVTAISQTDTLTKAVLHIYRADDDLWGKFHLTVNNVEQTKLKKLNVHTMEVDPGMVDVEARTFGFSKGRLTLHVEQGGAYYLRIQDRINGGDIIPKLEVLEVHERTYRRETGNYLPSSSSLSQ